MDSGYITSNPISYGRLVKRFSAQFTSNGLGISGQTDEIIEDIGQMSSVFAIGDVEAAGSGVLRVPIKILSAVTGTEKRDEFGGEISYLKIVGQGSIVTGKQIGRAHV